MHLVWFLTIGTILSITLGEFGQYPFGTTTASISLTDLLLGLTITFFTIWQVGIKKELKITKEFFLIILFWLASLLSLIFSGNLSGGLYIFRFIFYSLTFWIGFQIVESKVANLNNIYKVFVIAGITLAIMGFLQLLILPDLESLSLLGYDPHKNRLVSSFLDPNFVGAFLTLPLLISVIKYLSNKNKAWLLTSTILGAAIILTFSRSAYLTVFIELLIIGMAKYKKLLIILILIPLILYFSVPRFAERIRGGFQLDVTASERIESWQKGFFIFSQNPILGVGFNNLRQAFADTNLVKVFSSDGGNAGSGVDSSLLLVLATTGVIGFFIYISWWILVLKKFWAVTTKNKLTQEKLLGFSLITGLLINSQFINSLFYPPIMLSFYLIIGSIYGSTKNSDK